MSTVNANTTIDSIQDLVVAFKGQNADITTVTVTPGAEEPAEGSSEHATTFNATYSVENAERIDIKGSKQFSDTLNLKIVGEKDNNRPVDLGNVGDIQNVSYVKVNADNNVAEFTATVGGTSDPSSIEVSANKATITVRGAATVKTGKGDDVINVAAAATKKVVVDGGTGDNTVNLGTTAATTDFTKLSLKNIDTIDGKGALSSSTLDKASYTLANASDLTVVAKSGIDLSNITLASGTANITINDVKSGTVTLSNTDLSITEKVSVALGGKVSIENFTAGTGKDTIYINSTGAGSSTDVLATTVASAKAIDNATTLFGSNTTLNKAAISANGILTFSATAGEVSKSELTVANAQLLLAKGNYTTSSTGDTNFGGQAKLVAFTDKNDKSYIIDTGANATSTADDIIIELVGVDITKVAATTGTLTINGQ